MKVSEAIRAGFSAANRMWPLVLVEVAAAVISLIALFVVVAIPLIAAIFVVGINAQDFAHASPGDVVELALGYVWLAVLGLLCIGMWVVISFCLRAYTAAGWAGMLAATVRSDEFDFSTGVFLAEANRLFKSMLWYQLVMASMLAAGVFVLGLIALIVYVVFESAGDGDGMSFVKIMAWVSVASLSVMYLLFWLALSMQGFASFALRGKRGLGAAGDALSYMQTPGAAPLVAVAVVATVGLELVTGISGMGIQAMPVVGPVLGVPYQMVGEVFSIYLGLIVCATLINAMNDTDQLPWYHALEEDDSVVDNIDAPVDAAEGTSSYDPGPEHWDSDEDLK